MQSLKLNLQQCSDKYHFVVIGIVLLAISLYINLIFVFFLLYSYFIIKRKYLNKILIIIYFILSLLLIIFFYFYNYVPSYLNTNIYVSEVKENYFTFYVGFNKYLSYDKIGVKPGDILYIEGSVNEYLEPSYDGDFNTITFLRGKLVKGIYHIDYYEIKSYILTFTRLKCLILEYYQSKISSDYFDLFSFRDTVLPNIPMFDPHPVAFLLVQDLVKRVRKRNGAVLSARTADSDDKLILALQYIIRNQKFH